MAPAASAPDEENNEGEDSEHHPQSGGGSVGHEAGTRNLSGGGRMDPPHHIHDAPARLLVRTAGSSGALGTLLPGPRDKTAVLGGDAPSLSLERVQIADHPLLKPRSGVNVPHPESWGDSGNTCVHPSASLPRAVAEDDVANFFVAFYDALLAGEAVLSAIRVGEAAAPATRGYFLCFHL